MVEFKYQRNRRKNVTMLMGSSAFYHLRGKAVKVFRLAQKLNTGYNGSHSYPLW